MALTSFCSDRRLSKKLIFVNKVAATVPITDEHYLPVLTFRFWVLSTLFTALSAAMSQYFYFRYNTLTLNGMHLNYHYLEAQ